MRSRLLATTLLGAVAVTALLDAQQPSAKAAAAELPNDTRTIVHVLNRIGFGPRAGDVERVRTMGVLAYLDEQLHPSRLPDAGMEPRLAALTTLDLSSSQIAEQYARPLVEARRVQQQNQGQSDAALPGASSNMREAQQRAARVMTDLSGQKLLRAAYSDRQLQEVLTDFWFNHFNVDARKGQTRFMLTEYERDVIRPHVLGRFRDLLEAAAKSPAMLFYLDNWLSADPNGPHVNPQIQTRRLGRRGAPAMVPPPPNAARMRRGLNENYARELMELHTLGVDGGYTQKDVTEVARAFTGWTIRNGPEGGGFVFDPRIHDPQRKVVLGHEIKSGGVRDGEEVLDILAAHPSTARFISMKLARRFVSDTPPPAVVDRAARTFLETDGDLRKVMKIILTSPEFFAPEAHRAKVKTPFEFVVSAVRASGAEFENAMPLVRAVQQLGMPPYMCQPPSGYKDTADAWVNTGALVNRMNFALQLAGSGGRGPRRGAAGPRGTGPRVPAQEIIANVLNDEVAGTTRDTIARATTEEQRMALTLGSPEFQRR